MEDEIQYIDDFFQGKLSPEEVRAFEEKISNDPAFAANVAFYLSAKQSARDLVEEEKKKRYKEIYTATNGHHKEQTGKLRSIKYGGRVALIAAVLTAIIVTIFLGSNDSPQKLADKYVKKNYEQLSVTMGKETELQRASDLYNKGKYAEALAAFEVIIKKDNSSFQAVQYAGMSALRIPDFEKALYYFTQMESFHEQFSNPGVLLQAVTLMQRNLAGDEAQAKMLLQKVVDNNLDGKPTAEKWLKEGEW